MLIGLSGYAQSGKDSLAAALVEDHGFTRVAFADKLREVALESCGHLYVRSGRAWPLTLRQAVDERGWDRAKTELPKVRQLLQALGCAVRDHVDTDAWVRAALGDDEPGVNVVITDMRFPNEYAAVKARGGLVVRVERPGVEAVNRHVSETALDDHDFDFTVRNDGSLADLSEAARCFVTAFG